MLPFRTSSRSPYEAEAAAFARARADVEAFPRKWRGEAAVPSGHGEGRAGAGRDQDGGAAAWLTGLPLSIDLLPPPACPVLPLLPVPAAVWLAGPARVPDVWLSADSPTAPPPAPSRAFARAVAAVTAAIVHKAPVPPSCEAILRAADSARVDDRLASPFGPPASLPCPLDLIPREQR